MQDAAAPVGAVDGRAIHADITALNSAFSRAPNAYRNIGRMAQSIVGILDKQNRDVSQALKVADEYAGTIDRNRAALGMMVRSLASIERSLLDNRASVTACLQMLAEMLSRAVTLEPASATYLEPVLDKLGESEPALRSLAGKLDSAITTVRSTMRRLVAAAGPDGLSLDQSATTVDGSALCVPIPGRRC
jgi:phospholipid/cholesterol/gamma-HCH transport system substrate-binding protein